jgi:hypothetical protein
MVPPQRMGWSSAARAAWEMQRWRDGSMAGRAGGVAYSGGVTALCACRCCFGSSDPT